MPTPVPPATLEDYAAEVSAIAEENKRLLRIIKRLQVSDPNKPLIEFKIGPKGGVGIHLRGLRWPIVAYADKWRIIIDHIEDLRQFLDDNDAKLRKPPDFDINEAIARAKPNWEQMKAKLTQCK